MDPIYDFRKSVRACSICNLFDNISKKDIFLNCRQFKLTAAQTVGTHKVITTSYEC